MKKYEYYLIREEQLEAENREEKEHGRDERERDHAEHREF